ncbi:uncharacterized protein BJ171DRAFT_509724 [Polychytrium aggregatum]|uniref:uncharacterized protein n=1 Tax=Polychytrium aggregatum TaxID=110093 RepID=UPI0022FDCBFE|nr:uncharacterized protein BJ171DRAFT_509724 [Polychytrium aggregatum]KAI9203475.1 hypothetical protein BJ171DRAFT_509724 [Polychytrium aggregatum]
MPSGGHARCFHGQSINSGSRTARTLSTHRTPLAFASSNPTQLSRSDSYFAREAMTSSRSYHDVMVALDDSCFGTLALEYAFEHVLHNSDNLFVVSVVRPSNAISAKLSPLNIATADIDMQFVIAKKAQALVDEFSAKYSKRVNVLVKTFIGDPRHVVVTYANDVKVKLIVMGSRGLSGMTHMLGSVSSHVVQHASVPVLVVRPPGECLQPNVETKPVLEQPLEQPSASLVEAN